MATPVRFDQAAAATVAGQLELAATSLMEGAELMQSQLASTTDGWSGRFRSSFDGECASQLAGAASMAQTFLAEAARVRALALEAEATNQLIAAQTPKPPSTPAGQTPTAEPPASST